MAFESLYDNFIADRFDIFSATKWNTCWRVAAFRLRKLSEISID